eukprot:GABV01014898.1.p1 GENE.GABV01014898.1~~GABV01014898.1.p1  ORF type:complete len:127 (-),score=46.60 GABV01014898.1:3-383(-)
MSEAAQLAQESEEAERGQEEFLGWVFEEAKKLQEEERERVRKAQEAELNKFVEKASKGVICCVFCFLFVFKWHFLVMKHAYLGEKKGLFKSQPKSHTRVVTVVFNDAPGDCVMWRGPKKKEETLDA